MKKLSGLLALIPLSGLCALAQDVPKVDLFLGYSFLRANSATEIPAFTANGGLGTIAYNFTNHLAFEAQLSGYHNGNVNNHQFDTTAFLYQFGPRISFGRSRRVDPYFHVLFGGARVTTSIAAPANLPSTVVVPSSGRFAGSTNNFAMAAGGGLDIKLSRVISFRPIQLDYQLTRLQSPGILTPSVNRNQNNLVYAAGVMFTFGAR